MDGVAKSPSTNFFLQTCLQVIESIELLLNKIQLHVKQKKKVANLQLIILRHTLLQTSMNVQRKLFLVLSTQIVTILKVVLLARVCRASERKFSRGTKVNTGPPNFIGPPKPYRGPCR